MLGRCETGDVGRQLLVNVFERGRHHHARLHAKAQAVSLAGCRVRVLANNHNFDIFEGAGTAPREDVFGWGWGKKSIGLYSRHTLSTDWRLTLGQHVLLGIHLRGEELLQLQKRKARRYMSKSKAPKNRTNLGPVRLGLLGGQHLAPRFANRLERRHTRLAGLVQRGLIHATVGSVKKHRFGSILKGIAPGTCGCGRSSTHRHGDRHGCGAWREWRA